MLTISERRIGDVVILDLSGELCLGEGDERLHCEMGLLSEQGVRKVLLNLHDVSRIDIASLGELVRLQEALKRRGGRLQLLAPQRQLVNAINIANLGMWLPIFANEAGALSNFAL